MSLGSFPPNAAAFSPASSVTSISQTKALVTFVHPSLAYEASPHFRNDLEELESSADRFADALKKLSVLSKRCCEAERQTIQANAAFNEELVNLINVDGTHSLDSEAMFVSSISRIGHLLSAIEQQRETLVKHMEELVVQSSQHFVQSEYQQLRERKQQFEKDSDDYEAEVNRYCSQPRKKDKQKENELVTSLRQSKATFHKSAVEYCENLNHIQATKKNFFLEKVASYVVNIAKVFQTNFQVLADAVPYLTDLEKQLLQVRQQYYADRRDAQRQRQELLDIGVKLFEEKTTPNPTPPILIPIEHMRSSSNDDRLSFDSTNSNLSNSNNHVASPEQSIHENMNGITDIESFEMLSIGPVPLISFSSPADSKAGFLFKRSSGARKQWNRRWFEINVADVRLDYYSPKDQDNAIVAVYLRDAVVREAENFEDRRFVFQVLSNSVHYYLQAETEGDYYEWIAAIIKVSTQTTGNHSAFNSPVKMQPRSLQSIGRTFTSNTSVSLDRSDEEIRFSGEQESLIVKAGEIFVKRDRTLMEVPRRNTVKTLSRAGLALSNIFDGQGPSESSDSQWKLVYASLTRDGRWSLFEYEKSKTIRSRPARATKAIASADLASLSRHAIQTVHESLIGKRNAFSIAVPKGKFILSANTLADRDDWMMTLKRVILEKPSKELSSSSSSLPLGSTSTAKVQLRDMYSLYIELAEARNLISAMDVYAEISIDGNKLALSATKPKTNQPLWAEPFEFEDIPEPEVGLSVVLKSPQWITKDSELGHVFIDVDGLFSCDGSLTWYAASKNASTGQSSSGTSAIQAEENSKGTKERAELKMSIRFLAVHVLPLADYTDMLKVLEAMEASDMFEIAKTAENLEALAQNLVRLFTGHGPALSWLKALVASEIKSTEEINTLFRANSLATKAVDQYMKLVGMTYLHETIGETVRSVCESKASCEVDPTRLLSGEDAQKNWQRLQAHTYAIWNSICKSGKNMPYELRVICNFLKQYAVEKFPEQASSVQYTTVSGFLFLRFFCPAVLTPKLFGILSEHPDERTRRTLTLITKTLQSLANLGSFGIKEAFMTPMNEFLMDNVEPMSKFLTEVSSLNEDLHVNKFPIDVAYELAVFQKYIAEHSDQLRKSSSQNIKRLLESSTKLGNKIDRLRKISLGAFLMQ